MVTRTSGRFTSSLTEMRWDLHPPVAFKKKKPGFEGRVFGWKRGENAQAGGVPRRRKRGKGVFPLRFFRVILQAGGKLASVCGDKILTDPRAGASSAVYRLVFLLLLKVALSEETLVT